MATNIAQWCVTLLSVYAGLGLLFALPFAFHGAGRIDPAARQGTWGFRLLLIPGAVVLWPLLARRWLGGVQTPPEERNPHRQSVGEEA